jgi:hypothetical protein
LASKEHDRRLNRNTWTWIVAMIALAAFLVGSRLTGGSASPHAAPTAVSGTFSGLPSSAPSGQGPSPSSLHWMWSVGHLDNLIAAGMSQAEVDFFANSRHRSSI